MTPLLDLPHQEALRRLATGAPVYVFVNPIEYHGPHLSLHNDALLARGAARALHARLAERHPGWEMLVVDDVEAGVEPVVGPGSRHPGFQFVKAAVLETARALHEMGARAVIFMTFHGDPLHALAIEHGVTWLGRQGVPAVNPFNLLLRDMLDYVDDGAFAPAVAHVPAHERADLLKRLNLDFHGGFFETSLSLHHAPASVSVTHRELPDCPRWQPDRRFVAAAGVAQRLGARTFAHDLRFAAEAMAWKALRPFPGYTGRPALATAEAGAFFANVIAGRAAQVVDDVLAGRAHSPAPIMPWLERAALGGRLPMTGPALADLGLGR